MNVSEYLNLLISRWVSHVRSEVNRSSSRCRQEFSLRSSHALLNRSLFHGVNWTTFRRDWLKLWYSRMLPLWNCKKNGEERLTIVPLTDCIATSRYVDNRWLHSVHSAARIYYVHILYMQALKVHWIVKLRLLTPPIPVYFREPENLISS